MDQIKLSIIIPVFNGSTFLEEKLAEVSAWTKNNRQPIEVIVVNDGSKDTTLGMLNDFRKSMCYYQVVDVPVNHGKGFALRAGMMYSHGEYIGFTDADLPYGLTVFDQMYTLMENDRTIDILFGSRSHPQSQKKQGYGFLRQCGRLFFSVMVKLIAIPDVKDTQCGVKMLRRAFAMTVLKKSKVDRFAFDVELFAIARQNRRIYKEVSVELTHRKESSVHLIKDTFLMLYDILKIRLRILQHYYVWN